jgi:hypothetical protein
MLSKIYIEIEGEQAELLQYLEQLQKLPRPASIKWKSEKPTPTDWAKITLSQDEILRLCDDDAMAYYQAHGGWYAVMAEGSNMLSEDSADALLAILKDKKASERNSPLNNV